MGRSRYGKILCDGRMGEEDRDAGLTIPCIDRGTRSVSGSGCVVSTALSTSNSSKVGRCDTAPPPLGGMWTDN